MDALSDEVKTKELIRRFAESSSSLGISPLLILDEANLLISGNSNKREGTDELKVDQDLVEFLVQQTKHESKMSIALASSLHSYPRKLGDLGIREEHVCCSVAEEFTPSEITLLLESFGMGKSLIHLIVNAYGAVS